MVNELSKGFCTLCGIKKAIDFTNDVVFCTLIGIKTIDSRGQETTIGDKYGEYFRLELKNMERYFIVKISSRLDLNDKKAIRAEFEEADDVE